MKKLYIVGGPMGVGKTTVCQNLKGQLDRCVFLDGDWCWDMHPFQVTEETKAMVINNIVCLLNSFLACSAYESVIFCWVLHQQEVIDTILRRLDLTDCQVFSISLICAPSVLVQRLQRDMESGLRSGDIIQRSLARLPLYPALNTIKIDVSHLTPKEAAQQIASLQAQPNA